MLKRYSCSPTASSLTLLLLACGQFSCGDGGTTSNPSSGGSPGQTGGQTSSSAVGTGNSFNQGGSFNQGSSSDVASTATSNGGTSTVNGGATAMGGSAVATDGSLPAKGGTPASQTSSSSSSATGGVKPNGGSATAGGNTTIGTSTSRGGSAVGGAGTGGAGTGGAGTTPAGSPPALHVDGNQILDPSGKTIVLRGISLIDIGALWSFSSKSATGITARIDQVLASGLQPHVIRLPVYPRTCFNTGGSPYNSPAPFPVGTAGGTQTALTSDEYVTKILKPAVDYVTQKGMYVIIDYHQIDNTSGQSATDATTFWTFMAPQFASNSNVIFEAFNEPIDTSTTWATFKTRAQGWIDAIRKVAPNNLIIVPSMSWDQKPGDAASSPPSGSNLAYSAHVYPGNWNATFKQQVATAVAKAPVFFTEWGYILNGSDANLGTSSSTWVTDFRTLVDGNGASWTAWVADNSWTPNLYSDTGIKTLSAFGTATKDWLSAKATSDWVN